MVYLRVLFQPYNEKREKRKTWDHMLVGKFVSNSFLSMQSQNVPLSASVRLDVKNFQALNAYLWCWKERSNTTSNTVAGESKPVTLCNILIQQNYGLEDIYHAYRFWLLYRCFPKNILAEVRKVLSRITK